DRNRRAMPWRALPGEQPDPYRVWLSEVMLQQTTVAAVIPYYEAFVRRFPTIEALAEAPSEEVMTLWAGLGYYARARNLHACAKAVAASGGFPRSQIGLMRLPGIGEYTASAIQAIAFGVPTVPVDGNVERVVSRLFMVEEPMPQPRLMQRHARRLMEDPKARARPADFVQALFDLGATVCTAVAADCWRCPWRYACLAGREGVATQYPRRAPKKKRPVRYGAAFWLADSRDRILLRRRPESGLLGGTIELPGTEWRDAPWTAEEMTAAAPMPAPWRRVSEVRHGFTHFELRIALYVARVPAIEAADGYLCHSAEVEDQALSSLMRKCVLAAGAIDHWTLEV
ncbi:MAG: A/G-specific adenine glycosylase, partial [Proteobacteria bacterium]|nr:A/G-specific adenine glycosylase [Pseudomonadota bacterium]